MTIDSDKADSQPATEPADKAAPADQTQVAESSPADPGKAGDAAQEGETPAADKSDAQPKLSDALRNVLDESRKKGAKADDGSTPDPKANGKDAEAGKAKSETDEAAAEGEKPPPFNKHPRWIKLNANHAEVTKTANAHAAKITEMEPLAAIGRNFTKFRDENGLSDKDVEYGQGLVALIKKDPEGALEVIEGLRTQLAVHLGKEIPKDLQEAVDKGEITEAYAKQLHQERAGRKASETRVQESEAQKAERVQTEAETARRTAINTWFGEQRTKDPDFTKLKDMVADRLTSLAQARMAKDQRPVMPTEAVELCKQALTDVKARLKGVMPAKPAVEPKRTESSSPGNGSSQVSKAPGSLHDVLKATLAKTRG